MRCTRAARSRPTSARSPPRVPRRSRGGASPCCTALRSDVMGTVVTLYTRNRCSLCDKMHAWVNRGRTARPFDLRVVDLDPEAPAEKRAAYNWEVPVLEID